MRSILLRALHWILKHLETPETVIGNTLYFSGHAFKITRIDMNYSYIDRMPTLVIKAEAVDDEN